jgi:Asp-tRNA(Asn)/Glu-tRNA(Gln) amidotransferase A subunit family amidase
MVNFTCRLVRGVQALPGRLPDGPVYTESWMDYSTEGTITRSVRDCDAMMDATMGDEVGGAIVDMLLE